MPSIAGFHGLVNLLPCKELLGDKAVLFESKVSHLCLIGWKEGSEEKRFDARKLLGLKDGGG